MAGRIMWRDIVHISLWIPKSTVQDPIECLKFKKNQTNKTEITWNSCPQAAASPCQACSGAKSTWLVLGQGITFLGTAPFLGEYITFLGCAF